MDAMEGLRRLGGVARGVELTRAGVGRDNLLAHVQTGRVERAHRGCFALPGTPREAVLASIFRAEPACVTALTAWELPLYPAQSRTHLLVPESRGPGLPRRRPTDEVVLHRAEGIASVADHLDLAAHCVGPMQQLALADAALGRGLVSRDELRALRRGTAERRAWVAEMADPRAGSISESVARVDLVEAGFEVTPQASFAGIGRVDLVVEDAVVVELDGVAYHSDSVAFRADRERDRALALLGYRVLRYTFMEVMNGAPIADDVAGVLWRAGRLTPAIRTRMDAASRVSGWRALA
ncbi:MAG: endonuclease domain-containing protein [Demequina sp.]|uniref:endonuclease domain-containing protein n=1 Tax=Demequina sp. TaxID=2050685 RepID=UPI003A843CF6